MTKEIKEKIEDWEKDYEKFYNSHLIGIKSGRFGNICYQDHKSFIRQLLSQRNQQLLKKVIKIIEKAETEDCRECSGGKLTKDYILEDINKLIK